MCASKSDDIVKEKTKSYRAGIRVAADFADTYNSWSFHDFRLGDCIRAEFGLGIKKPRRNNKSGLLPGSKREVLRTKVGKKQLLQFAQAIEPERWSTYVKEGGRVSDEVEKQLNYSLMAARRALNAGYRDCVTNRDEPSEIMLKYLSKRAWLMRY